MALTKLAHIISSRERVDSSRTIVFWAIKKVMCQPRGPMTLIISSESDGPMNVQIKIASRSDESNVHTLMMCVDLLILLE